MATFQIPKSVFVPYPAGQSEGIIYEVEDLGEEVDPFAPAPAEGQPAKTRHRVAIKIESLKARMDDGRPYQISIRCNMSGHPRSTLRQRRESIAGRKLTEQEAFSFDSDSVVGVRVGFSVDQREGGNGSTYSNIASIWRLDESRQSEGRIQNAPAGTPPRAGSADEDDLPF